MFLFIAAVASKIILNGEEKSFVQWMRTNNKIYTGNDYHLRLGIFITNTRWASEYNRKGHSFTVGNNKFATYTPSEFNSILGLKPKALTVDRTSTKVTSRRKVAPESFDWRDRAVVNPIKDQAQCGSCWAFSAISAAESAYAIKNRNLLQFSEQNLVDCVTTSYGCSGGNPETALLYVLAAQMGMFMSEDDYPYTGVDGGCLWNINKAIGSYSDITRINGGDEDDMANKIATIGVASVCIDAVKAFQAYTGGIYDDNDTCFSFFLNHAINCVGYGSENGTPYWIVRNSWGTDWGEEGYIRMLRGVDICGISTSAFVSLP
ncbi:Pro-cathepsin H [Tritrichomonas foetus]|uniref:Pro-cathepsin H n=1 Tax=Tritrichomonas foetus TaxID=1144522 RepID=A0A1J4JUN5_9EUKA|nr:Pro-cathepsin H [Tritrichomonas foetus]|eukprot:OHT02184.1 Pro-cathepsin H [Tritrichomonas foetus]